MTRVPFVSHVVNCSFCQYSKCFAAFKYLHKLLMAVLRKLVKRFRIYFSNAIIITDVNSYFVGTNDFKVRNVRYFV